MTNATEKANETNLKQPVLRAFVSYYKPHWKLFALDMFCALMIAAVDLLFPMVSRYAMQNWLPVNAYGVFFGVMAALVLAYIIRAEFQYFVGYWGHLLGVYMEVDMRRELFTHLQKLSFRFYDQNRTGSLMSRVSTICLRWWNWPITDRRTCLSLPSP